MSRLNILQYFHNLFNDLMPACQEKIDPCRPAACFSFSAPTGLTGESTPARHRRPSALPLDLELRSDMFRALGPIKGSLKAGRRADPNLDDRRSSVQDEGGVLKAVFKDSELSPKNNRTPYIWRKAATWWEASLANGCNILSHGWFRPKKFLRETYSGSKRFLQHSNSSRMI